ncbi:uncharacterized protein LOC133136140 isoform X2 [Conger conger]|uniref:uncharacterized protein LOC133136140 isoform X2 n=1 Tax=Conger conger TaxID=82655 RepID=UPI002A5AA2DC|nr:uncharacterized protein LOC133136140 isoform X2 [Conger conger]
MLRPLSVWSWASVQCLLLQSLINLSASDPSNIDVFSQVGQEVMLPCHCRSTIDPAKASKHPYLWWETPMESVFELEGPLRFEAPKYRGRVDVRLQGFEEEGNCSLLLQAVRFSDAGLYESFVQAGGRRRRFVRSVELNVRDHKDSKTLAEGERLHLKLHTTQDVTVVFRGKDGKAGEIWRRWGEGEGKAVGGRQGRLVEREGALILSEVKLEDSGTYRVLDPQGLAVSTLLLTVEPEAEPMQPAEREDAHSSAGRASSTSPIISALMLFSYFCLKL